jgi:hypothetical protein
MESRYLIGREIDSASLPYILYASNFATPENKRFSKIEKAHFP